MNLLERLIVSCMLIGGMTHAAPLTPDQTRQLAAGCANCHGTDGQARMGMPVLAARNRSDLVELMQDYKNDRRQGSLMNQLAKGYEDAEIEALAQYFSQFKP